MYHMSYHLMCWCVCCSPWTWLWRWCYRCGCGPGNVSQDVSVCHDWRYQFRIIASRTCLNSAPAVPCTTHLVTAHIHTSATLLSPCVLCSLIPARESRLVHASQPQVRIFTTHFHTSTHVFCFRREPDFAVDVIVGVCLLGNGSQNVSFWHALS